MDGKEKSREQYIDISVSFGDDTIPIEKRIKNNKPTCDGLYPHEVLILSYAPRYTNKPESYHRFWDYSYGISGKKVSRILNSLYDKGYICRSTIEESIKLYTIPFFKDQLKKRGLKVSGKKNDLFKRLLENISEDERDNIFTERFYKLTEKGEKTLEKYEWVVYLHNHHQDIDLWNFAKLMEEPPLTDFKEKIWIYYKEECDIHLKNNDYGFYRNTLSAMYNFAYREGDYRRAFEYLCEKTAYQLTYVRNEFTLDMFIICLSHDSNYACEPYSIHRIGKYWIEKFVQLRDLFGWTDEELRENIIKNIAEDKLPIRLFTPEECGDIVIAEIHEDESRIKEIYGIAKNNFKEANMKYFQEIEELRRL